MKPPISTTVIPSKGPLVIGRLATVSGGKHSAHSLLQPHPHAGPGWKTVRYHRARSVSIAVASSGASMSASPPTAIHVQQNDARLDTSADARLLGRSTH